MDPAESVGPVRAARMEAERRAAIRRRAMGRLPWAAPLPAAAIAAMMLLQGRAGSRGVPFGRWIALGAAMAAVPLLTALLELVAGCELRELSRRWDSLAGWQRGVIGAAAAAGALAAFGAIGMAVAASLVR